MPPEAQDCDGQNGFTGRCYCGASSFRIEGQAATVSYCHCADCRRITGAPVAAFAAFSPDAATFTPPLGPGVSYSATARRWFCPDCGSPLAASFTYLPGQLYLPIGLFDEAERLPPQLHSHSESCLPWLHIEDDLPRHAATARAALNISHP